MAIKAGTQVRNLERGIDAEAMEGYDLLAFSPSLTQPAFLCNQGPLAWVAPLQWAGPLNIKTVYCPRYVHRPMRWGQFFTQGSVSPGVSSLCQLI